MNDLLMPIETSSDISQTGTGSVWIFARPLSFARKFVPFQFTSNGKYHLCHWGVLVSSLPVEEMKNILVEGGKTSTLQSFDYELGQMWELNRIERNTNTVNVTRPFKVSHIQADWRPFSAEYLGETPLGRAQIQHIGIQGEELC